MNTLKLAVTVAAFVVGAAQGLDAALTLAYRTLDENGATATFVELVTGLSESAASV